MREGRWLALIGAFLALAAPESRAAEFEVRAHSAPSRALIFARGKIVRGDLDRFRRALREANRSGTEPRPILVLDSPGGLMEEAMAIGRLAKRSGIPTALFSGSYCASACSFIFFGGFDAKTRTPDRTVYGAVRLGVHHWSPPAIRGWSSKRPLSPSIAAALNQEARRQTESYFNEMKVSAEIRKRTYETAYNRLHLLTFEEMAASDIRIRLAIDAPYPQDVAWRDAPVRGANPMSGVAFLKGWFLLHGHRIRIDECTFWRPRATEGPCSVSDGGIRIGSVSVQASLPEKPGWTLIRERCWTAEPIAACRVSLTGTVRLTTQGPVLVEAKARFLDAPDDLADWPDIDESAFRPDASAARPQSESAAGAGVP